MTPSRQAALTVAAAFTACTAIAIAAARLFLVPGWTHPTPDFPAGWLVRAWVHWDAGWYAQIVRDGYWLRPGAQSPVAYFPGYPLAIRALAALGLNRFHAAIAVTAVAGTVGILLFHRWARRLADEPTARRATILLAAYPFAFYLYGAMYSDALFFALAVGAFLCLESGSVLGATVLGALATASRPVAPALVLGLLVRHREIRRARGEPLGPIDALPLLSAAGVLAYAAYLGATFGDPLAFAHVHGAPGWEQPAGWRTWLKVSLVRSLVYPGRPSEAALLVFHALLTAGALALAIPTRRRLGWGYAIYVLVAIGLPALSSKDLFGLGRYALAAFPCFLVGAGLLKDRPRARAAWLVASAALLAILTAAYAADAYVA